MTARVLSSDIYNQAIRAAVGAESKFADKGQPGAGHHHCMGVGVIKSRPFSAGVLVVMRYSRFTVCNFIYIGLFL